MTRRCSPTLFALIAALLVCVLAACTSPSSDPKGPEKRIEYTKGLVKVSGQVSNGSLVLSATKPTPVPSGAALRFVPKTSITVEATGKIQGQATLTFSYPTTYATEAREGNLFVMRYSPGIGWIPQGGILDADKRTVTVKTNQFSTWSLATYDLPALRRGVEALASDTLYNSSLVKGATGLLSIPAPLPRECATPYESLDTSEFYVRMKDQAVCVYPVAGKPDQYKVVISNRTGLAVKLSIPPNFKLEKVLPKRENLYSAIAQLNHRIYGESAVVIGSGQQMTFAVDSSDLGGITHYTVHGEMDVKYALFDAAITLLQLAVPFTIPNFSVEDEKLVARYRDVLLCYAKSVDDFVGTIQRNPNDSGVRPFLKAVGTCVPQVVDLVLHLMGEPGGWQDAIKKHFKLGGDKTEFRLVVDGYTNKLDKLLGGNLRRLIRFWEDSGAFTQLFATGFTLLADKGVVRKYHFDFYVYDLKEDSSIAPSPSPSSQPSSDPDKPCANFSPEPGKSYWFTPCSRL